MMKIRNGFVTNSSSTNFLIISKKEITTEFLFKKLGFKNDSILADMGWELCNNLLYRPDIDTLNFEDIKNDFGIKAAEKWQILTTKGYNSLRGRTHSEDDSLTSFFTMDSFEIDEKDFYINGKNCIW